MLKYLKNKNGSAVEMIYSFSILIMAIIVVFLCFSHLKDELNSTRDMISDIVYTQAESQVDNNTVPNLIVN